jgi:hypothetical protein
VSDHVRADVDGQGQARSMAVDVDDAEVERFVGEVASGDPI